MPWFLFRKEYQDTIVVGGLIGLLLVVIAFISTGIETKKFDQSFDSGLISVPANVLSIGQTGNPLPSDIATGTIPYGYGLGKHPRQIDITGCQEFEFNGQKLYAAAPSIADQITVSMPLDNRGQVEVCAPKDLTEVPVYLWEQ